MDNRILKYLVLSDIHLGHAKNPTDNIVSNLMSYFKDNHMLFKTMDIVFVAGDIFDKLLMSNSKQYLLVVGWLTVLSNYCSKNNIKLRILEGTKSHDWQQASVLNTILKEISIDLDFKYIDTLHIERMDDLDLNILYVPDEYNHEAKDTLNEVRVMLASKNLTEVDIAIMHGQFHYQLPMITLKSSHDEDAYTDITKYFINIGHIHKHSVNGKILAQGSFDRLVHGEEEPKGAMVMSINRETDNAEYLFIKNKNAMTFKTLDYRYTTDSDVIDKLNKLKTKLREGSHIRVLVNNTSMLAKSKNEIRTQFPMFNINVESKDQSDKKDERIDLNEKVTVDSFNITRSNIKELLAVEVGKHKLTAVERSLFLRELKEVV